MMVSHVISSPYHLDIDVDFPETYFHVAGPTPGTQCVASAQEGLDTNGTNGVDEPSPVDDTDAGDTHRLSTSCVHVTVKLLTGKELDLELEVDDTVDVLMAQISDEEDIQIWQQRLIFNGKQLVVGRALSDYGVQNGSVIHLVVRKASKNGSASSSNGHASNANGVADVQTTGQPIQRGAVGLQNLGNTCFMNSSLQCLSNIPPLRDFFVSGQYEEFLNTEAYKTQGQLAEAFAQLLSLMWDGDTVKVAPRSFKSQIGECAEQFSGYGQQDSMELLECVLDALREDCNQVRGKKPYIEWKEAQGRPDDEVASEVLVDCKKRSDSRVDDLFLGLFKSVVQCPENRPKCGRTSVTFDPFLSVKLPLVCQAAQGKLQLCVNVVRDPFSSQRRRAALQVSVIVSKDTDVEGVIKAVTEKVNGLQLSNCLLIEVWHNKVQNIFAASDGIDSIRSNDVLVLCEVADPNAFVEVPVRSVDWVASECALHESVPDSQPWPEPETTLCTNSSFTGVVLYHRQAPSGISRILSGYRSRPLHGLPMLLCVPREASCREFGLEVSKRIRESSWEVRSACTTYRLYRIDRSSPTHAGTLVDVGSDAPFTHQQCMQYCAVEWQDDVEMPEFVAQAEMAAKPSKSTPNPEQDLRQLLRVFVEGEHLGEDDAWYCDRCKGHRQAFKKLEFHYLPPVLVLQLKRFKYTRYSRERLNIPVTFPLEGLDLAPYCTESARSARDANVMLYDLAGVSKHIGSLGGGHYVAHGRSSVDGEWYTFDDSEVRHITAEEVASDTVGAYVLFYIRRDFRPATFNASGAGGIAPAAVAE